MEQYKGIKIDKQIIIVEKHLGQRDEYNNESIPQGYIVNIDNKKMLDTALSWAKTYEYPRDETTGKYLVDEEGHTVTIIHEGIVHTYENGLFEFTVHDSADRSSQGGKLSFWTAVIKAPDNKEFRIGINADILLDLIKNNDFLNGVCQNKVWLGRIKGSQVGAFTANMPDFKQAIVDEQIRNTKPTVKYEIGDILKTKTETLIYMGEQAEYFSLQRLWGHNTVSGTNNYFEQDFTLVVDDAPVKHYYYWEVTPEDLTEENINTGHIFSCSRWLHIRRESKKLPRIVDGHVNLENRTFWDYEVDYRKRNVDYAVDDYNKYKTEYNERDKQNAIQRAKTLLAVAERNRELAKLKKSPSPAEVESHLIDTFESFVNEETFAQEYTNCGLSQKVVSIMKQSEFLAQAKETQKLLNRLPRYGYYWTCPVYRFTDRTWILDLEDNTR